MVTPETPTRLSASSTSSSLKGWMMAMMRFMGPLPDGALVKGEE